VVHQLVTTGQYRRHLNRLKARLSEAFLPATRALTRAGVQVQPADPAGYYLWATLPRGLSELALARQAAQAGIFLAPGSVFFPERRADVAAVRVNVAYANDPRFLRFLAAAVKAAR
jgi:DNA-binding transcriptional MocR family regulator